MLGNTFFKDWRVTQGQVKSRTNKNLIGSLNLTPRRTSEWRHHLSQRQSISSCQTTRTTGAPPATATATAVEKCQLPPPHRPSPQRKGSSVHTAGVRMGHSLEATPQHQSTSRRSIQRNLTLRQCCPPCPTIHVISAVRAD